MATDKFQAGLLMQSYITQYSASPCHPFAACHFHSVSAAVPETEAPIGPLRAQGLGVLTTHLNPTLCSTVQTTTLCLMLSAAITEAVATVCADG